MKFLAVVVILGLAVDNQVNAMPAEDEKSWVWITEPLETNYREVVTAIKPKVEKAINRINKALSTQANSTESSQPRHQVPMYFVPPQDQVRHDAPPPQIIGPHGPTGQQVQQQQGPIVHENDQIKRNEEDQIVQQQGGLTQQQQQQQQDDEEFRRPVDDSHLVQQQEQGSFIQDQLEDSHLEQGHMEQGQFEQGPIEQGQIEQGQLDQGHLEQGPLDQGHLEQGPQSQGQMEQNQQQGSLEQQEDDDFLQQQGGHDIINPPPPSGNFKVPPAKGIYPTLPPTAPLADRVSCIGKPPGYYANIDDGCRSFYKCVQGLNHGYVFGCPPGQIFEIRMQSCEDADKAHCGQIDKIQQGVKG